MQFEYAGFYAILIVVFQCFCDIVIIILLICHYLTNVQKWFSPAELMI